MRDTLINRHHIIPLAGTVLIAMIFGCESKLPTTADEVYEYVRNGLSGAEVRRLDGPAQEYVEQLFEAFQNWQNARAGVNALADLSQHWPMNDDRWRDGEMVKERLKTIRDYQKSEATALDRESASRAELRDALRTALASVPDLPDGKTRMASQLQTEFERLISIDSQQESLDELVAKLESLYSLLESAEFQQNATGLKLADAQANEKVKKAWSVVYDALLAIQQSERREIKEILTNEKKIHDEAAAKKKDLRLSGEHDDKTRREIRSLELLIRYHYERIKWAESRKRELDAPSESEPETPAT